MEAPSGGAPSRGAASGRTLAERARPTAALRPDAMVRLARPGSGGGWQRGFEMTRALSVVRRGLHYPIEKESRNSYCQILEGRDDAGK